MSLEIVRTPETNRRAGSETLLFRLDNVSKRSHSASRNNDKGPLVPGGKLEQEAISGG